VNLLFDYNEGGINFQQGIFEEILDRFFAGSKMIVVKTVAGAQDIVFFCFLRYN
jgi:hypothetical protein